MIVKICDIKKLFDIGVEISLGEDNIVVTGRDFHTEDCNYIETMFEFDQNATLDHIYSAIKSKKCLK